MKRIFCILTCILSAYCGYSQSDSLWNIWVDQNQPDTTRMKAIDKIADGLYKTNPDSALKLLDLEFAFATQKNQALFRANILQFKGLVYTKKVEHENALKQYLASWELYKTVGSQTDIARILLNIGTSYQLLGDHSTATDFYQKSLTLSIEVGNKELTAKNLSSLGSIYQSQGDYAKAFEYYTKSIALNEELKNDLGISSVLNNMSILCLRQGNFELALELANKSLAIRLALNDKRGIANTSATLGTIYAEQKSFDQSIDFYTKSLAIREEIKDKPGIAALFNNIATVYNKQGKDSLAMDYVMRGLSMLREIGDKRTISTALINIGGYHLAARDFTLAKKYITEGHQLALETQFFKMIQRANRYLFTCFYREQDFNNAMHHLATLRNLRNEELRMNYFTLSEKEKELYFTTMEEDFGLYYDFTLYQHKAFPNLADTAFNTALQIKGLTLKSSTAMRMAIIKSGDSLLTADYEKWLELRKKISSAYSKGNDPTKIENEANELEKQLAIRSNAFSDFDKIKNLDWKGVQSFLKPDECAIEFVHVKSEIDTAKHTIYIALLVRPESEHPEVIRLCNESDLIQIIGTLQGNNLTFVNQVYGTRKEAKTALYQKVWQPLEKYLDGVKTIYYSPSGLLHKISFASISTPQIKKTENIFLSDLYDFRQMGSTGNIALSDKIAFDDNESFFLMGGVNYNTESTANQIWSYLPGSMNETELINSYLTQKKYAVKYYNDINATEDIFKEKISGSSVVHIATHGFFFPDPEKIREEIKADSEFDQDLKFRGTTNYANWSFVNNKNPLMRSGIVLAHANDVWERDALAEGEDGILTAQEVSTLDLSDTKLVVLSACETGLGDIKGSEGVFGLQRAFKMAGVKYLIMSLWQVPDKETSEFMQVFYKNLLKLKNVPAAFQKTQKVMRKKYDPYYWGAFVLIE